MEHIRMSNFWMLFFGPIDAASIGSVLWALSSVAFVWSCLAALAYYDGREHRKIETELKAKWAAQTQEWRVRELNDLQFRSYRLDSKWMHDMVENGHEAPYKL